jgi:hypothetical protein
MLCWSSSAHLSNGKRSHVLKGEEKKISEYIPNGSYGYSMIINTNKLWAHGDIISIDSKGEILVEVCSFSPPIIKAITNHNHIYMRQYISIDYRKNSNMKFVKKNKLY